MSHIPDKIYEFALGGALAVFGFLSKRTFQSYDRRIQKTEDKQDAILTILNNLEKQMVRVATKLESEEAYHGRYKRD